jgi:hypothetical protein
MAAIEVPKGLKNEPLGKTATYIFMSSNYLFLE